MTLKNMTKNKVFCKNCSWYRNTETVRLSSEFVDGRKHAIDFFLEWGIVHCMHPDCFTPKHKYIEDVMRTLHKKCTEYTRIKGCHQFNSNFDCTRYKRKFWKFWVEWV